MEKFKTWLVTSSGRRFSRGLAVTASLGGFAVCFVPEGLFLDNVKSWLHMYSDGEKAPLKPAIEEKAKKVLESSTLSEKDKNAISFFNIYGFDILSFGSTFAPCGAIVGIPSTFNYKNVKDIPKHSIQLVNVKNIDWGSPEGTEFQKSMILNEQAQNFAIAREIYRASQNNIWLNGVLAASCVLFGAVLNKNCNSWLKLYQKNKLKTRLVMYSLVFPFSAIFFLTIKDMFSVHMDYKSDKQAAEMGEEYLDGGIEFYQKVIERNKALRILLEDYGPRSYTAGGNDKTSFRTPVMPFTARLDILLDLKKLKGDTT